MFLGRLLVLSDPLTETWTVRQKGVMIKGIIENMVTFLVNNINNLQVPMWLVGTILLMTISLFV